MEEKEQFAPTEIVKDGKVTRRTFVKGAGMADHHVRHRRQRPWLRTVEAGRRGGAPGRDRPVAIPRRASPTRVPAAR